MQARNFTTNVPKILDLKSSSEQIFSQKLSLGAPEPGWKVNGARLFEAVQRKICGSNETSEVNLLFDFWFQIY